MRIHIASLAALLLVWLQSSQASEPPFTPHFEPADCTFAGVDADWPKTQRVDCGWLEVLQSRDAAEGRRLKLWVAIARADTPSTQPPLLYLHGGPGPGTVDYFFPYFPKSNTWTAMRQNRDLIYFDQRGTGRSEPVFCPELKTELESLRRQALPAAEDLERSRAAFAACRPKMLATGFDFGAYNTSATVEDAEDLRRALKVEHWNLYGISYGTLVALDYLRRHPDSVGAAILDSVYPPNSAHGMEQISATALAYAAVQRACDRQTKCKAQFPDIVGRLASAIQRLNQTPLATDELGRINGARLRAALWNMLVTSKAVEWLPLAVERAAAGDRATILGLVAIFGGFDGFGDYSPGQSLAVTCHDITVGHRAPSVRLAKQRYPAHSDADTPAAEYDVLCGAWQTELAPMAFFAPVQSATPVLIYGGEFDPATPYQDAVLTARHLSKATVVEVLGSSHAGMGRDECTRSIAHRFLADPSGAPDLSCVAQRASLTFQLSGLDGYIKSMLEQ